MATRNTLRPLGAGVSDENSAPQPNHAKQVKRYATRAAAAVVGVGGNRRALGDVSNRAALQSQTLSKHGASKPTGTKKRAAGDDPIAHRTRASRRRAEQDHHHQAPALTTPDVKPSQPLSVPADDYTKSLILPDDVVDIDCEDEHLSEPTHAIAIMRSHLDRQESSMASPTYMSDVQRDLTPRMRSILIDWLVDVHRNFKMEPPSLYLAVNLVDRFLSQCHVVRSKLQLVGVAALWMASKYEDIFPPILDDFVAITDWTYTRQAVISMEALIANRLQFRLTVVTPLPFLARVIKALSITHGSNERAKQFAHYCVELALCDYEMVRHPPSLVAAAAVALAIHVIRFCHVPWDSTMVFHSGGYRIEQLQDCAVELWELVQKAATAGCKHTAVRRKYSDQKYAAISLAADDFEFSFAGHREK